MINTKTLLGFAMTATLIFTTSACQKTENKNTAANNTTSNTNQAASTPAPVNSTAVSTGTPTDAYKAAYTARKNKDIEGLKKMMSKDVLEFLTMVAEADEKKKATLDDQLKELCDKPQAATAEARNEKIDGDYATIEYLDEKGGWKQMEFTKEGGIWKIAFGPPKKDSPDKDKTDKDKQ